MQIEVQSVNYRGGSCVDFDYIVIGSGFGGSVSALRLSEKGYRVAVVEQGRRIGPEDFEKGDQSLRHLLWMPSLGMRGYFFQRVFKDVGIFGGIGVGGGSLVYAAVLLKPRSGFFQDPAWSGLGPDWKTELAPHYDTATQMLGVTPNPYTDIMDVYLQKTAQAMGAGATYGPVPNGIYFGQPEQLHSDPYFKGQGPERKGCSLCGACLIGCRQGSKNSLDKNYLYLAEKKGVGILPNKKVTRITPLARGGYRVHVKPMGTGRPDPTPLQAQNVVLSAGVLGTLELLFHCRDEARCLPRLSPQLGRIVRTNSEAIVGSLSQDTEIDLTHGTAISSDFYPDPYTHITQNRFPQGYTPMKYQVAPLVDGHNPFKRALRTLRAFLNHPVQSTFSWRARNWHKRISVLSVMQHHDNQIRLTYGRSPFTLFMKGLQSQKVDGKSAPTYLPVANQAARIFAQVSNGQALNVLQESLTNLSTTAHILGGCHMGRAVQEGVIDTSHQVFGYPGLFIIDGSALSANVGVNPSLTIIALAERAMSLIPPKS